MAEPQPLAQSHPKELWGALVGAATIIMALVSILYNRLNGDIKGHDESLENGEKRFQVQGEKLERLSTQFEEISRLIGELKTSLETGSSEFRKLGETTVKIQAKLEELEKENVFNQETIDGLKDDFMKLHDTIIRLETEHTNNHKKSLANN